jgi:phage gp29-like protein
MAVRISRILGPDGQPVEVETLDQEIAAPTLAGVRSVLSGHPAQGLDPYRLGRIMREAEQGDATAYYELAEEIEENYLHYQGQVATRKRAVTQLPITVEAASDDPRHQKDAELMRDWLKRGELKREGFNILDAIPKGISFTEMVWNTSVTPWFPKLVRRPQTFFDFDQVDRETPLLRGGPDGTSALPTPLPPYRFLVHRHVAKTGLAVRGGLARGVAWAYLFQNMSLKNWVIFAEIYGIPMRLGKYGANATQADKNALLRAVVGIGVDAAGIIPDSMSVEFVNAMANGNPDVFEKLNQYLDMQVSKAVVGQTATADAVAGGLGGSQGTVHNEVRQDIRMADTEAYEGTINAQLIPPIIDFNHGPPPGGLYPCVMIGEAKAFTQEERENVGWFIGIGGRVEESVIRDKLGLPDPPESSEDGTPVRLLGAPKPATPENPPQEPQGGQGAPLTASAADRRLLRALRALSGEVSGQPAVAAVARVKPDGKPDAIDGLVNVTADGWVEVMAPLIDAIDEAAKGADSYEALAAKLLELQPALDVSKLTIALGHAGLNARLAGEAGIPKGDS